MSNDIQRNVSIVLQPSEDYLNRAQLPSYNSHRGTFIEWLEEKGNDEDAETGYAFSTVRRTAHDHDTFARWVWINDGGFTTDLGTEQARDYLDELAGDEDSSATHRANTLKSRKRYHRWVGAEWEPCKSSSGDNGGGNPKDWLTKPERKTVREAALDMGTAPATTRSTRRVKTSGSTYWPNGSGCRKSQSTPTRSSEPTGSKSPASCG